ncbi:hypothetical protein K1T71_008582 [Dendrolimus kikuchii]|uniref:Uncharacterized protein n=1 Tax=Dendrolimus kikuchii TaxID=765133 RepID=A0ACC1CV56_9NEOP|nr:hypothetical protein K1T71_008582 [Dendrolimus kikuchii]
MIEEDNKTLWCGNISEQVTEEILYELFLQAGPLEKVRIARDRDGRQKNFAFITYCHAVSVPYAINLFRGTALFHRTLSLQCRSQMASLPPPIRCFESEPNMEILMQNMTQQFIAQQFIAQQFVDMTEKISNEDLKYIQSSRRPNDDLTVASLQGNWSHRHHPYRHKDKGNNDDHRARDKHDPYKSGHSRHSNNWKERRSHKKNSYHRRD